MDSAMYYFDTLPLRRQPQPLESFTSYLTRVAEANGKRRYSQLNPFFGENCSISSFADYPPRSFGMLPGITNCGESALLRTTFYHVGKKFGKVFDSPRLAGLLSGVIASSLRYCPLCLQEALYYSLAWRFLPLIGCPKHACRLMEQCGHCNCSIPIFPAPFRMGVCPTCGGDLRACISSGLTEEEVQGVCAASREIDFLLCPHPWETTEPAFLEKLGQEFMLLRYNKQLKRRDISAGTDLATWTLGAIELGHRFGHNGSNGTKLRWYFEYAHYLGVPLSHIFINTLQRKEEDSRIKTMPGRYFLTSEDEVMERVQDAVSQLEISGQRLTLKAVCAATGFSQKGLYKYERVKTFLGGIWYHKRSSSQAQDHLSEEQLLEKALQAVQELAQTGKPITHQAVCSLIGISSRAFLRYPRVNAFLEQKVTRHHIYQRRRVQPVEELVQRVKEALVELSDHGEHITLRKVARQGKMSPEVLKYPQVVVLLEQHGYQKRKPRSERAEELLNLVKDAINRCKASGELISKESMLHGGIRLLCTPSLSAGEDTDDTSSQ